MFHFIEEVKPLLNYRLLVKFKNGENKEYDVKPLFAKYAAFTALKEQKGLFNAVRVDVGGAGIVWNDNIDLDCDSLYFGGQTK